MKKLSLFAATAIVAMSITATSCDSKRSADLKKPVDSASYAAGIIQGTMIKRQLQGIPGDPINTDVMLAAMDAAIKGDSSAMKMTMEKAQAFLQSYFTEAEAKVAKENKEKGDKFLAENKTKEGVITTESGLQYKVITEGTGAKPTASDRVKVHYKGTLLDGTVFDSSYDRGDPAEFALDRVIKGWTEGIQIMPVGSKYIFWIPSELAYGERAMSAELQPNSTLQFEVELLDIVKDEPKK